jgi:UPF0716 protein FxsA
MPLLVLLFIALPIAELYVIFQIGSLIGVLPTIALLLADGFLGAALLRSQGRSVWRRFNLALEERRVPASETLDGAMVIFGGALLMTPGFITDAFGLILLLPPTRALIRRGLARLVRRRLALGERVVFWRYERPARPGGMPHRPYDVEGTGQEVGEPGGAGGSTGRPERPPLPP